MTDLAVRVAYLGEGFSGSQIQPGLRTVEGSLTESLERFLGTSPEDIDLRMASRTDRGVNSTGNVASLESGGADPVALLKAVNSMENGLFLTAYARVPGDFHPRHADLRTYEYAAKADGIDIDLANECLSLFRGRHDFSGFCKSEGKDAEIDLVRAEARLEGGAAILTFQADHFLWNMVRRISSAVLRAASDRMPVEKAEEALAGGWSNFGLAPAEGLTLTEVLYDGLEFTPSPDPALRFWKEDGMYRAGLASRFYSSLRACEKK